MTDTERTLPDFDDPPVIETVLGVSFSPLQGWDLRHYGVLWDRLKEEYPRFQVQPALNETEEMPSGVSIASLIVRAVGMTEPPIRAWYIDPSETMLLQVQRDRFLHNWRKVSGSETYPHYESTIRPHYIREWSAFRDFLQESKIEAPELRGWEVTYVNHFEKGKEWETFGDLHKMLNWFNPSFKPGLLYPDGVNFEYRIDIGDNAKLSVSFHSAVRQRDKRTVLVMNLTARGDATSDDTLLSGLDYGRAAIVEAFANTTTPAMHQLWKRRI